MRQRRDPMERLAAADPLPDAEQLTPEEEREAEALLARLLATPAGPAGHERRERRPRRRRWALAAAGVACSVAAAFAAINLVDSDEPGPGVVERAVAAVTRGDVVYHVLERLRATGSSVPRGEQTIYFESWHTTDGRTHQKTFASRGERRGRLLEEFAGRRQPGRRGGRLLRYDPMQNTIGESGFGPGPSPVPSIDPFEGPGAQLRALQQQGRLRAAGTTRVGGRRAYRLVSGPATRRGAPKGEQERIEFVVDAETYLPLAKRHSVRFDSRRTLELFTRYLVYERLPLNARSRPQLALDPHPGARCSRFAHLRRDRDLGFPNPCPPSD